MSIDTLASSPIEVLIDAVFTIPPVTVLTMSVVPASIPICAVNDSIILVADVVSISNV